MPPRWRELKAALQAMGCTIYRPSSGSHWIVEKPGGGMTYPLPAHGPGSEMQEHYIRQACKRLGLDERELRKLL